MATVTVTIPDEQAARIASAICGQNGYQPTSTADAVEFVKETVFRWLTQATINYEAQQASTAVLTNPDDPLVNAQMTQQ
jgi:hypothetical protein